MAPPYGEGATISQGRRRLILTVCTIVTMSPHAFGAPVRLLVLGDSLTAGYGLPREDGFQAVLAAALKARGISVSTIDGAVSGDTSAGGLARLGWVLGDGADAAIVELGANDGLRGLDPSEMERNLTAILDRLASGQVKVLLSGM
jgi:acyl-CoA thioesterase I